ncbi:DMT family transporter [Halopseudomonas bauzanensis]|uniref:DMT family transporter n=1 Tax=Halopseudomonas bauzanensis TaxID=653930 RepID=A0A4U0YQQ0_9GAMM|nr:DMT family transporter [Halopseudomonas bauzanensis]TKA92234.1 DMT family transporter [Halopseudomonas bauzanensis]
MTEGVAEGETSPALWGMHLALMATMVIWALNVTLIKWLVTVMDAMQSATLRMGFAALTLLVLVCLSRQRLPLFRGRVLLLACCSALLMVYANQLLFVSAMTRTTASNAALLLALNPLFNGVMEALFFRKRLRPHYLLGLAVTLSGVCLVVFNNSQASWGAPALGDLLVLGSMLAFALGVAILQFLSQRNVEHPGQVSLNTFIYTVGSLALLLHISLVGDTPVSAIAEQPGQVWLILAFSGAGVTALGAIAWGRGVATIGAGRAAVYMSWVPVLGVAFGALVLKEPLTVWHFIAMLAVILGTALCNLGSIRLRGRTVAG